MKEFIEARIEIILLDNEQPDILTASVDVDMGGFEETVPDEWLNP